MKHHHYSSLQDVICESFSSPHDIRLHTNYKKIGLPTHYHNLLSSDSRLLLDGRLIYSSVTMVILLILTSLYSLEQSLITTRSTPLYHLLQSLTPGPTRSPSMTLLGMSNSPKLPSSTSRREPRET